MTKHLWSIALLAALVGNGCRSEAPPAVSTPQPLLINTFAQKWLVQIQPKFGQIQKLYMREDLLLAYTSSEGVCVTSRENGQLMQIVTLPAGLARLHPPVVLKDYIIFPTLQTLEIYDRKSGEPLRSQKLNFPVRSDAIGTKNSLYLGADYAGGGRAVAIDLAQAYVPQRWELMFPQSAIVAAPAYANDTVFIAAEDGSVAAVAADTRDRVWDLPRGTISGSVLADLQVDETGVFVVNTEGRLFCLNRNTGKVKWQYFANNELKTPPTLTKDLVYQFVPGTGIVALDKTAGVDKNVALTFTRKPRWTDSKGVQFLAADDKHAYVRQADNRIAAVDKVTGKIEFLSKRSDFVAFASNVKDATIYAATKSGAILGIVAVTKPGGVGEIVDAAPETLELTAIARGN